MRLLEIFENQHDAVWYHGSPDARTLSGGFEQRTKNVSYITDPKGWQSVQNELNRLHGVDQEAYMDKLKDVAQFRQDKTIRSPLFFTNNRSIASTYAKDNRAWDYQAAEPAVITAQIDPGKLLTVNGQGQEFRGIDGGVVERALVRAGIDAEQARFWIDQHTIQGRRDDKLSTDDMAAIAQEAGFDTVDVTNIRDAYNGGGTPSTVRLVFDPSKIKVIQGMNEYDDWDDDEPEEWEPATYKIPAGTKLYHGTSDPDFDPRTDQVSGPFWVSDAESVARDFGTGYSSEDNEHSRVFEFTARDEIYLWHIQDRSDFDEFEERTGYEMGGSSDEMADAVCQALPVEGWIIPHNYANGADIMLCNPDSVLQLTDTIMINKG